MLDLIYGGPMVASSTARPLGAPGMDSELTFGAARGHDGTPHRMFPVTLVGDEVHMVMPDDI
jgi:hypothetical protein